MRLWGRRGFLGGGGTVVGLCGSRGGGGRGRRSRLLFCRGRLRAGRGVSLDFAVLVVCGGGSLA